MKSRPAVRAAWLKRAAFAALVFVAGIAVGYAIAIRRAPPLDEEIRPGRVGFTNPLIDCEVSTYPPGRELPPFKKELVPFVEDLVARGEASEVAMYFRDLDNGPWTGIDEEKPFTPGSLLKVPLMMACLLQADLDPSFLRREILYQGVPDEGGIGAFAADAPLVPGRTYTVRQLIEQVAVHSDNSATWLLYNLVDLNLLERLYRDLGFDPELVRDTRKPAAISPKVYGRLFRVLYNASYLSREKSELLLALMSRAVYREGLLAGVPPGVKVSHKFGVNTLASPAGTIVQLHDCGIVYSAQRPYFLCVMTRGTDKQRLARVIAQTSRFVSERVERPRPQPSRTYFK
jgi:beta-lactamase class A